MISAVCFDLYGTLADIRTDEEDPALWRGMAFWLSLRGRAWDADALRAAYGEACAREERRLAADRELPEIDIVPVWQTLADADEAGARELALAFRAFSLRKLRLFPDALETLDRLRAMGRTVILLSNAQPAFTRPELRRLGLEDRFERVFLSGTLNMRKRYGVSILECAFEVAADYRTPDTPTAYRLADEKGATLLAARTSRDPARGLVVERTDGGAPPASPAEPILGTDVTWLDVGIDFVNWRNPALAGEDRLKGRVCDLLDVEPAAPTPGCAKARLWVDRAQKVVMQAAQVDENGREVRKLWVRAVQKVDDHWIFKDLEVETAGTGHRTRLHFDNVSFPDSALSPAR